MSTTAPEAVPTLLLPLTSPPAFHIPPQPCTSWRSLIGPGMCFGLTPATALHLFIPVKASEKKQPNSTAAQQPSLTPIPNGPVPPWTFLPEQLTPVNWIPVTQPNRTGI